MTDTAASPAAVSRPRTLRALLLVLTGVAASAAATTHLAVLATLMGAGFAPLEPLPILTFAIVGTLLAIAGWVLVVRFVKRSAPVLRVLVPALVAASLIPDVILLATGFIPGTTPLGVVALMLMHVVVAASAVAVGRRIAPPRG